MFKPSLLHKDVELQQQQTVFGGFFKVAKYTVKHRLFQGGWSQAIVREVFVRHDAVGILLFDPVLQKVALVEQFRAGAYSHNQVYETQNSPWICELVAGLIDKDEQPADVARRESEEEAGIMVKRLEKITEYFSSPGSSSERFYLYCGEADLSDEVVHRNGEYFGLANENEDIRLHVVTVADFFKMLELGHIANAHTLIAAQWLQLQGAQLTQRWLA